jgi:outer membrane protein OmpA-like peptidoglycan-associated protein
MRVLPILRLVSRQTRHEDTPILVWLPLVIEGNPDMRCAIHALVGTVLLVAIQAAPAVAQNEGMGVLIGQEEIVKALRPGRSRTRSLGVESRERVAEQDLPKIDLRIGFEYASDRLTQSAQKELDQLAAALQDPSLKSFHFMIAGHTDGAGSELYNQQLSERRAAAVKAYLVAKGQIEAARLTTVGLGKSKLLNPGNPMSAENRRVEIINLLN